MIDQETALNYDPNTKLWHIWTNEMKWRNWIRKYAESHPDAVVIDREYPTTNAISAHFPKEWMRMPKPKKTRKLRGETEEELRIQTQALHARKDEENE